MSHLPDYPLELSKANRLRLSRVFRHNLRVDMSIDCVVENQMGAAFVDNPQHPTAYRITIGPFWYFAGDAESDTVRRMIANLPPYNLLMPSPEPWAEAARAHFGSRLVTNTRTQFSSATLSPETLSNLRQSSSYSDQVRRIDVPLATQLAADSSGYFDFSDFESAEDFVARGIGYCAIDGDALLGVAYSSLSCSRGIEVSIVVGESFRRRGVATALATSLLLTAVEQGLEPNWDAANPESVALAEKLGYARVGQYEAYFYTYAA